ncbi:MAG: hypothetical protein B7Z31_08000 [Rhodobacterales bacterium 12-65-15]|nr:MAG: hypothetical protein B7Z31_08000 [Rhodobacterales bacterium 12-65-15]
MMKKLSFIFWCTVCLLATTEDVVLAKDAQDSCASSHPEMLATEPPYWGLTFLFNFENSVTSAFPIGSDGSRLLGWLKENDFYFYGADSMETAFVDEPAEVARMLSRSKAGETINLSIRSHRSICGRMVYSVGWNIDECNQVREIYADTELCQFDM